MVGPDQPAACDATAPDDLPLRPLSHHLALTIYWLSNTVMWGSLLHLGLQTRVIDWFGEARLGFYFAILGFAGGLVGSATQILVGAFSDRTMHPWGRRRIYVVLGTLLSVPALLLLGASRTFWPFCGALMLVQLFTNAALGPFTGLLPDTVSQREYGKASGFMGAARLLGDTGGLLLAGMLLSEAPLGPSPAHDLVVAFHNSRMFLMCALLAGFTLICMILTCLTIKERPLERRPDASLLQIAKKSFSFDVGVNADFFWLAVSRAVTNVGFYMFLAVMPMYVRFSLHAPDYERTNMFLQLPGIGAALLSSVACGLLSDRIGRRRLIFAAQFIMAAASLGFGLARGLPMAYVSIVPGGIAYGIFTAVEWAFMCSLLPPGDEARYLGVWNAAAVVPQIMAGALAGAVGSAVSSAVPGLGWRVDFGVVVVCCLLGAWFLVKVTERRPARASTTSGGERDV